MFQIYYWINGSEIISEDYNTPALFAGDQRNYLQIYGTIFGQSPLKPFYFSNFEMYYFTTYRILFSECWWNGLPKCVSFTYQEFFFWGGGVHRYTLNYQGLYKVRFNQMWIIWHSSPYALPIWFNLPFTLWRRLLHHTKPFTIIENKSYIYE